MRKDRIYVARVVILSRRDVRKMEDGCTWCKVPEDCRDKRKRLLLLTLIEICRRSSLRKKGILLQGTTYVSSLARNKSALTRSD